MFYVIKLTELRTELYYDILPMKFTFKDINLNSRYR